MRIQQIIAYCLVLFIAIGFAACKTEQATTNKQLAKKLKVKDFDFDYLTIKSKLRFNNGGKDQKVAGYIRMKKDSIIWMTMSKTNVEGVRIVVTKDSIMMLNRLDKVYYTFNYEQLQERFNFAFDYDMLQSVITGNVYLQSTNIPKPEKTDAFFIVKELIDGIMIENQISRANSKLAKVMVVDDQKNQLNIDYDEFEEVEGQLMPHHNKTSLEYQRDGVAAKTELELNYTKVNIPDKPLNFPFRISSKYKKAELAD